MSGTQPVAIVHLAGRTRRLGWVALAWWSAVLVAVLAAAPAGVIVLVAGLPGPLALLPALLAVGAFICTREEARERTQQWATARRDLQRMRADREHAEARTAVIARAEHRERVVRAATRGRHRHSRCCPDGRCGDCRTVALAVRDLDRDLDRLLGRTG